MSPLPQDSPILVEIVWVLRESFLAYERFHGVFISKGAAKAHAPLKEDPEWKPIQRKLPTYMWDELDPFNSDLFWSECAKIGTSLWVVEPRNVEP